jgi:hypothetical protein
MRSERDDTRQFVRRGRLWRRFYYLQYLKLVYNKYKTEYQRWNLGLSLPAHPSLPAGSTGHTSTRGAPGPC